MLIFKKKSDGGPNSGVSGYWLIEIKWLFSIVLLKFNPNDRENFHSHAFNALTFWLKGNVQEQIMDVETKQSSLKKFKMGNVKYTPRDNVHKIHCTKTAWAISFRGKWKDEWFEYNETDDKMITLTHGRKVANAR
jgi:hypothetical protein